MTKFSCILLSVAVLTMIVVPAQGQDIVCGVADTCNDCLDLECGWVGAAGCIRTCDEISADACYSAEDGATTAEVCAQYEVDEQDNALCTAVPSGDCATCTSTIKADGVSPCEYYPLLGVCARGGCVQFGCGETTCSEDCSKLTSCFDCVDNGCGWSPDGCIETCALEMKNTCYSTETFPGFSSGGVCDKQLEDLENVSKCFGNTNCEDCLSTELPDDAPACAWYSILGTGTCCGGLLECAELGTPSDTCDGSNSADCFANLDCTSCLTEGCAWFPVNGLCFDSCSVVEGGLCFAQDEDSSGTTDELCQDASATLADINTCSGVSGCATCTSTIKQDGESPCFWYPRVALCGHAECLNESVCGTTTCDAYDTAPPRMIDTEPPVATPTEISMPVAALPTSATLTPSSQTTSAPVMPTTAGDPSDAPTNVGLVVADPAPTQSPNVVVDPAPTQSPNIVADPAPSQSPDIQASSPIVSVPETDAVSTNAPTQNTSATRGVGLAALLLTNITFLL